MGAFTVLVTGSRHWPQSQAHKVTWVLNTQLDLHYSAERFIVKVGDCPTGVDRITNSWARTMVLNHVELEVFKADWKTYGKAAGPIRNQAMVDSGADVALVFLYGKSVGTKDCARRARAAGITDYTLELVGDPEQ